MEGVARYNDFLPALNATLNGSAAVFLGLGYYFIKNKQQMAHRNMMITAFLVSSAFLVSYLYYHFNYTSRHFPGTGFLKILYLIMLFTHVLGAIVLVPGVIASLLHAKNKNWIKHKRWTRWVWPLWMYTSVTGVLVYFSLYGAKT